MRATTSELMTIGEFSRRSRLSQKALRLYDAMGLLVPARVDAESGYRYYRAEQLADATLVARLRRLGMPLPRIALVLEAPGAQAAREIAAYWREVEAEVRTRRRLARYLEQWLEGKGHSMYDVETREMPEQKVLSLLQRLHVAELPAFLARADAELREHLRSQGLAPAGRTFAVYHGEVNEDSDGPVEVCVPFAGSLEPAGLMRVRLEPARAEAFVSLAVDQVEFPGILAAYDAVRRWLDARGLPITDSPREVYHGPLGGPEEPGCDVAWPYQRTN